MEGMSTSIFAKARGSKCFYSLIFWSKSISICYNLRAICLTLETVQIWKMAVRVCLETATPPVFGKETDKKSRPIPQTQVSAFFGTGSRNERILQGSNAGPTLQENGSFQSSFFREGQPRRCSPKSSLRRHHFAQQCS